MITTCTRPDSTVAKQPGPKYQVLMVSSDSNGREISNALQNAGCRVDVAHGMEGLDPCRLEKFAAIVVDLVPSRNGAPAVVKQLRRYNAHSAILVLTSPRQFQTRVEALKQGADDYLVEPCSTEQLLDRMLTAIHQKRIDAAKTITVADLTVDSARRLAWRDGQQIDLTPREFELLRFLATQMGEIVSREEIREYVYKADASTSNIVDVYIRYLRKKIEFAGKPKLLHTFRGRGYMLGHRGSNDS